MINRIAQKSVCQIIFRSLRQRALKQLPRHPGGHLSSQAMLHRHRHANMNTTWWHATISFPWKL